LTLKLYIPRKESQVSADDKPTYKAAQCPQCGAAISALEESIICQYCGTRLIRQSISSSSSPSAPPVMMKGMKFSTVTRKDLQGTGMNAFRLLIPSGWQFQGGVSWLNDNPGMPAVVAFRV
jgi:DNA-directed RNA polymerase subunit RPC12/RpoP